MKQYLALSPNIKTDSNLIFDALDFKYAKKILTSRIKIDTILQQVTLIELNTLKTKTYFIQKLN